MPNRYISIEVVLPDGHVPVSYSRGMNVGVGGRHLACSIAPGEPVRRATLNEIRRKDRVQVVEMLASFPTGRIRTYRWWAA